MEQRGYIRQGAADAVPPGTLGSTGVRQTRSEQPADQNRPDTSSVRGDVCVVGAGIVGLCNALQYSRLGCSVVLIDEMSERQQASYKVGESLLIFPIPFLRDLGLDDFLDERSFAKEGFWMVSGMEGRQTFGPTVSEWAFHARFPQRWRLNIGNESLVRSMVGDVQIVRPEIESILREKVANDPAITFICSGIAREIQLGEADDDHQVSWASRKGTISGLVHARWVVDCSGRGRFLSRQLGHDLPLSQDFRTSSVWGQFEGCTDLSFGEAWRYVFPDGETAQRDRTTVHLWGDGYWIWLIRLAGDRISVGVSFNRDRAPCVDSNLRDVFWKTVRRYPVLDFLRPDNLLELSGYRNLQYMSDTYVSARRYGLAGDAAGIIDALYSQGLSLSLSTSWHLQNIVRRDIHESVIDRPYIDRLNAAALADWQLMRVMVRGKYTSAILDRRFFLLDHLLDYIVISGGLLGRYRIAKWLTRPTAPDDTLLSRRDRRLYGLLTRRLYLTLSGPLPWLGAQRTTSVFEYLHRGLERRARWRLENGVTTAPVSAVLRFDAALPAIWRLPFARRRSDLTPRQFREPAALRVRGTETTPILLIVARASLCAAAISGLTYDVVSTALQRLRLAMWPRRHAITRPVTAAEGTLPADPTRCPADATSPGVRR